MRFFVAICLLASAARAGSVSDELSVNSMQSTDANPRAGSVADSLNASFDLTDAWSLDVGGMLTVEGQTPAAQKGAFGTSATSIATLSLGVDWDATDSWSLSASMDFSPRSTLFSGTQVPLTAGGNEADALLKSASQNFEAEFDVNYDTAGDSALEWSFGGGLATTHMDTDQQITKVRTASGAAATTQQIRDYCTTHKCTKALLVALRAQTGVTLDSQRLSGSATAVIRKDTDLTLAGSFYIYDQDPTQVGYYGVASIGKLGNGLPIAPLQWTVRPEVVHRFGSLQAKLWIQGGQYVAGTGQSTAGVGAKVQYKFTKAFKMWALLSGQRDVDDQGIASKSSTVALGAGYRF